MTSSIDQEPVPIDGRRAQQSAYTGGDQDTGLPLLAHGEPQEPTDREKTVGLTAIQAIRAGEDVTTVFYDEFGSLEEWSAAREARVVESAQPPDSSDEVVIVDLNNPDSEASSAGEEPVVINDDQDSELKPKSHQPTLPFERLTREIGHAPDLSVDVKPLTRQRQQKIFNWQLETKRSFDLIQRAEGEADPRSTYWGAGNRIKDLTGSPAEQAAKKSSAGRAAVYGLYSRTIDHRNTAQQRLAGATRASQVLGWNTDRLPSDDDMLQLVDSLQELGNDIAANMDNKFPGGHEQAQIAGNSVIALAESIRKGEVTDLRDYKLLYKAAVSNSNRQLALWRHKIAGIEDFSKEMGIDLGRAA